MDAKQAAQTSLQKQVDGNTINDSNAEAKDVSTALDALMPKMAEASLRGLKPEFLRSSALALLRSNDYLRKNCDIPSILHGVLQAALLGLRLDPALGQACLVPERERRNSCRCTRGSCCSRTAPAKSRMSWRRLSLKMMSLQSAMVLIAHWIMCLRRARGENLSAPTASSAPRMAGSSSIPHAS